MIISTILVLLLIWLVASFFYAWNSFSNVKMGSESKLPMVVQMTIMLPVLAILKLFLSVVFPLKKKWRKR